MAVAKFLVFAFIVAALLPAGREMLDDLVREVSITKHQTVLKNIQPETIGSVDYTPSDRRGR